MKSALDRFNDHFARAPKFEIKKDEVVNKRHSSHQKFLRQDIIDYPRHLRFSSNHETVAKIQYDMRRQKIFHKEYDPAINSQNHLAVLEGVYNMNEPVEKVQAEIPVHEFIRQRGNIEKEPNVKQMKDLVKIFGKCPGFGGSML